MRCELGIADHAVSLESDCSAFAAINHTSRQVRVEINRQKATCDIESSVRGVDTYATQNYPPIETDVVGCIPCRPVSKVDYSSDAAIVAYREMSPSSTRHVVTETHLTAEDEEIRVVAAACRVNKSNDPVRTRSELLSLT